MSRSLLRLFRTVLRKSVLAGRRPPPAGVVLQVDRRELRLQAANAEIALEYVQPGSYTPSTIVLPTDALADLEGRKETPVCLEENADGVVATWRDGVVPQVRQFDAVDTQRLVIVPEAPDRLVDQTPGCLPALHEACLTTSQDEVRFATNHLQLRGRQGQVVATDGKHLLLQGGFRFPWAEDLLVPSLPVFGVREFASEPVQLGKGEAWVTLAAGPWRLHLAIRKEGRFPNVDAILPKPTDRATEIRLLAADTAFLLRTLPLLPGADGENAPVTVVADQEVLVRAKDGKQPAPTEVVLTGSDYQGRPVRFAMNRAYLERALRLGLTVLRVAEPDRPVVCRDEQRTYVWQPLPKESVLPASADAVRLLSNQDGTVATPPTRTRETRPRPQPSPEPLPATPTNGQARTSEVTTPAVNGHQPKAEASGIAALIAEAEALKELLRDAYTRTHQLVLNARRYRKQAQAVKSALGSLRQLQHVDA